MQTEKKHETYPLTWKQMVTSPFIVMCSFIFTQNSHIYNFTNVNRGSFTAVSAVFILHQAALWQRCWTEGQHSGFFLSKRWNYLLETQNHSLLEHKNTHHSLLTIWADTEQCCWRLPVDQLSISSREATCRNQAMLCVPMTISPDTIHLHGLHNSNAAIDFRRSCLLHSNQLRFFYDVCDFFCKINYWLTYSLNLLNVLWIS